MSKRTIHFIIVHHSLSNWGDGETIRHWHTDKKPAGNGWSAPGYHVVICNGYPNYNSWSQNKPVLSAHGRVDRILSEDLVANGCKYANADALHVCLIGNYDTDFPPTQQKDKLLDLLTYWCKTYSLDPRTAIYGHGEMMRRVGKEGYIKSCPGKNVNMGIIRAAVAARLKG